MLASALYARAYDGYLHHGTICNTLREGSDSEGGYLVPDEFERRIIKALKDRNVLRSLATVIPTKRLLKIPVAVGEGQAYWVTEEGLIPSSDCCFDQLQLDAHKLGCMIRVSDELLEDSTFDIAGYIADSFAERLLAAEEEAFLDGDGKGKPLGLIGRIRIMKTLNSAGIPAPEGGRWNPSVIDMILRNEKYAGDLLLQKTYCTDYIRKTMVVNDGSEVPKYYAQNSHPAIISAEVFDLIQMEMEWRRSLAGRYSGKSCFSSRILCGDCGAFYGSKVWHSTDEYRRIIWRCNNKYEGGRKCSTPHITQDALEKALVSVCSGCLLKRKRSSQFAAKLWMRCLI